MRGADALEAAERIDTVVFDKTGTLTRGTSRGGGDRRSTASATQSVLRAAATDRARASTPGRRHRACRPRTLRRDPRSSPRTPFARPAAAASSPSSTAACSSPVRRRSWSSRAFAHADRRGLCAPRGQACVTAIGVAESGRPLGSDRAARRRSSTTRAAAIEALAKRGVESWMITGDHALTARGGGPRGWDRARARACGRAAGRTRRPIAARCRRGAGASRWSATASTMRPRSRTPTSGSRWASGTDIAMEASAVTLVRGDLRAVPLRAGARAPDDAGDPAEPVLGVRLQRGRHPDRGRRVSYPLLRAGGPIGPIFGWQGTLQPDAGLARDGVLERLGGDVVAQTAAVRPLKAPRAACFATPGPSARDRPRRAPAGGRPRAGR